MINTALYRLSFPIPTAEEMAVSRANMARLRETPCPPEFLPDGMTAEQAREIDAREASDAADDRWLDMQDE